MSELRSILADTVTRLFTDRVTKDVLETAEQGQWPAALWQALEESGLTLPLVPEKQGGAGGTWGDAHVVLAAAGRFGAPVPLAETIIASWLLSEAGLEVPLGPLTVAPVHRGDVLRLERGGGGGWRLSGTAQRVPWGGNAGHLVVVTSPDGPASGARAMVALVAAGHAQVTPDRNLALEPRDTLVFDSAPVLTAAPAPTLIPGDIVRLCGALARSAQMAGGLESLLAQTIQYAGERKQFGKPIGSFQAIQWQCAILGEQTAAAASAAASAFSAADRSGPAEATFEIAVAKSRTGEAAGIGAGIAHQVHGAIGFTYEHSLHFVTRRLWSWRAECGGESDWAERLGREAASRGADALWPYITSR